MTRKEIVESYRDDGCEISRGRNFVRLDPVDWDSDVPSVEIYSWVFYVWGDANPAYVEKSALKELAFDLIEKGHGSILWP